MENQIKLINTLKTDLNFKAGDNIVINLITYILAITIDPLHQFDYF